MTTKILPSYTVLQHYFPRSMGVKSQVEMKWSFYLGISASPEEVFSHKLRVKENEILFSTSPGFMTRLTHTTYQMPQLIPITALHLPFHR